MLIALHGVKNLSIRAENAMLKWGTVTTTHCKSLQFKMPFKQYSWITKR